MRRYCRWEWTMRPIALAVMLLALVFASGTATAGQQSGFGFRFDAGLGWSTMGETMYSDARWSSGALVNVEEYWRLDFDGSGGPSMGAAFFVQFNRFVSLEFEGRGLFTSPDIRTDYDVYWDWNDGRSLWNAYRGYQYDSPTMRTMVGSINLVTHLTDRGPARPFLTAGFSAYDTAIRGAYDTAYAYTYTSGGQQYLEFDYPVMDFRADTSTIGFNVGVGADMQLNRAMALTFMVKYYHSEREEVNLRAVGGSYPELQGFVMEVDPSFWITTGGIKFIF